MTLPRFHLKLTAHRGPLTTTTTFFTVVAWNATTIRGEPFCNRPHRRVCGRIQRPAAEARPDTSSVLRKRTSWHPFCSLGSSEPHRSEVLGRFLGTCVTTPFLFATAFHGVCSPTLVELVWPMRHRVIGKTVVWPSSLWNRSAGRSSFWHRCGRKEIGGISSHRKTRQNQRAKKET